VTGMWGERDMEEAMELIHRIQAAHGGRLPEGAACEKLGPWYLTLLDERSASRGPSLRDHQRSLWLPMGAARLSTR
jgi:hypothetical protein